MPLSFLSSRYVQHIFNKYPISPCRVIHQYMGNSAHQSAILDDRTAAHE